MALAVNDYLQARSADRPVIYKQFERSIGSNPSRDFHGRG